MLTFLVLLPLSIGQSHGVIQLLRTTDNKPQQHSQSDMTPGSSNFETSDYDQTTDKRNNNRYRNRVNDNIREPTLITPCNYPTPRSSTFASRCRQAYLDMEYICDIDREVSKTEALKINETFAKHKHVLYNSDEGKYRIGFAVLSRMEVPSTHTALWSEQEYKCLGQLRVEEVELLSSSDQHYIDTFASVLHTRWFGIGDKDNDCNLSVLVLVLKYGTNSADSQQMVIKVDAGTLCPSRGKSLINHIEKIAQTSIDRGDHLSTVVSSIIDATAEELGEKWVQGQRGPKHQIPRWALQAFAGCFILVIVAMTLEWWVVRRHSGIKRSAASAAAAAGGSGGGQAKTHMMF